MLAQMTFPQTPMKQTATCSRCRKPLSDPISVRAEEYQVELDAAIKEAGK
jgi:hypothetical protein